jgi:hypothetical protein
MVEESGFLPLKPVPIKQEIYRDAQKAASSAERHVWFKSTPALRTLSQIRLSGMYDVEVFRTKPMSKNHVLIL